MARRRARERDTAAILAKLDEIGAEMKAIGYWDDAAAEVAAAGGAAWLTWSMQRADKEAAQVAAAKRLKSSLPRPLGIWQWKVPHIYCFGGLEHF